MYVYTYVCFESYILRPVRTTRPDANQRRSLLLLFFNIYQRITIPNVNPLLYTHFVYLFIYIIHIILYCARVVRLGELSQRFSMQKRPACTVTLHETSCSHMTLTSKRNGLTDALSEIAPGVHCTDRRRTLCFKRFSVAVRPLFLGPFCAHGQTRLLNTSRRQGQRCYVFVITVCGFHEYIL